MIGRGAAAKVWCVLWLVPTLLSLLGCAPLSRLPDPVPSFAEQPAGAGPLAAFAKQLEGSRATPEASFFRLLHDNEDALKARIALADLAARTLDIQYFIWQDDATGQLLMQHVISAADRGVRVRLLLDDLALGGHEDKLLAELDAHPMIAVRVFNPWITRSRVIRPFEFVVKAGRLNHRMHNKTFIADGHFAILGGRNIGDRYFGAYHRFAQNDLDVLLSGEAVGAVAGSFDRYWNSPLTLSISAFTEHAAGRRPAAALRRRYAARVEAKRTALAAFAAPAAGWKGYFAGLLKGASSGKARLLVDSPRVDGRAPTQLYEGIKRFISQAHDEVLLSSPYLIPDQGFVDELARLVARGVRVRIVTNSLASNSHVIAHTGYKKWRRALLRTGAELYEMRPEPKVLKHFAAPVNPEKLALHAKAIVIDGRWTFIGSPNLDPRSMVLNTEIGLVIDDRALAKEAAAILERDMRPANAWRVTLDDGGWLHWTRGNETLNRQPANGFGQRAQDFFLNLLPIKNQT